MKRLIYLALFFTTSCSMASETVTDRIELLEKNIHLATIDEKCYLINGENRLLLHPKPPCHFLREPDKSPQYYAYPKVGVDAALIVAGTPISDSIRKEWGISENLICGFQSQGVLIKDGKVSVTDKTLDGGVLCRDEGADEKNYWYISH